MRLPIVDIMSLIHSLIAHAWHGKCTANTAYQKSPSALRDLIYKRSYALHVDFEQCRNGLIGTRYG